MKLKLKNFLTKYVSTRKKGDRSRHGGEKKVLLIDISSKRRCYRTFAKKTCFGDKVLFHLNWYFRTQTNIPKLENCSRLPCENKIPTKLCSKVVR